MSEISLRYKVLTVSSYGPPHPGGLERAIFRIYHEVKKAGVQVRWLLSDAPPLPEKVDTIRVKVWNQLDRHFGLPIPIPKPSAYLRLYLEISRCDVVHLHDGYYFICMMAALMAKFHRKQIVITVHIWDVPYKKTVLQFAQRMALALMVKPTVLMADSIVTYNRYIFQKLTEMKGNPRYIANGIDPFFSKESARDKPDDIRIRLGLPVGKPIAIFAGRYSHKKGLNILREAATALPDILFVMCGTGVETPATWQLPNVHDFGWVDSNKLKELFLCSDLFLLPSRGEGFPLAVQEAMSCGLVCAVYQETWDAWGEERNIFLILDDFPSVAEAIKSYFGKPQDADWRERISTYANTNWSPENMTRSYLEVYRDVLNER